MSIRRIQIIVALAITLTFVAASKQSTFGDWGLVNWLFGSALAVLVLASHNRVKRWRRVAAAFGLFFVGNFVGCASETRHELCIRCRARASTFTHFGIGNRSIQQSACSKWFQIAFGPHNHEWDVLGSDDYLVIACGRPSVISLISDEEHMHFLQSATPYHQAIYWAYLNADSAEQQSVAVEIATGRPSWWRADEQGRYPPDMKDILGRKLSPP